jgi:hypothetical protein
MAVAYLFLPSDRLPKLATFEQIWACASSRTPSHILWEGNIIMFEALSLSSRE